MPVDDKTRASEHSEQLGDNERGYSRRGLDQRPPRNPLRGGEEGKQAIYLCEYSNRR